MGNKAKRIQTGALHEAISRLGLRLAFETRTGMEIDRRSKWPTKGKYEYCLVERPGRVDLVEPAKAP